MPRKSWWARLPFGVRMTAGAAAMFVVVGGTTAGITTVTTDPGTESTSAAARAAVGPDLGAPTLEENPEVVSRAAAAAEPPPRRRGVTPVPAATTRTPPRTAAPARTATTADRLSRARVAHEPADRTGPRPARTTVGKSAAAPRGEPAASPVVTTRTDVETRIVPFDTQVIHDPTMPRGTRRIEEPGANGEETRRYLVTMTDGRQTARRLLGTSITKQPETRVVALGSNRRQAQDQFCDQLLNFCLPFGRSAVEGCAADPALAPSQPEAVKPEEAGELLPADEDLEPLNRVRLEPATLC